jgi:hypothetical protein
MAARPKPAANSQVGAFVDLNRAAPPPWHRERTPWPLVAESFRAFNYARILVLQNGAPIGVLSPQRVMRSVPSPDDYLPPAGLPPSVHQLTTFFSELETVQPGQQHYGRVVNSWFADEHQQHVSPALALAANRIYHLGVNIGDPERHRSNVKGEQPEIGAQVVRYAVEQQIPVTLSIDSEDFIVLENEKTVRLPQVGATEDAFFRIATPVSTGMGELRLRVYLKNNLIQSYAIHAHIAPTESAIADRAVDGWWAECEYTLSASFGDASDFRYRRVCVWFGKGHEQLRAGITGLTGQPGTEVGLVSDLNPVFLSNALARYRELLEEASIGGTQESARYLYQDDLTPTDPAVFDQSIKSLAELGQMLYYRVFGEANGRAVARQLHSIEQIQPGPMIVQISRLSLDLTFPWDILYDRPLVYRPQRNVVCYQFASNASCQQDCPYAQDPNVVCPYGFWGFRYIIEQPLRPPHAYASVCTRIQAPDPLKMAAVYGSGLGLVGQHRRKVSQIAGARAQVRQLSSVDSLLAALKAQDDLPSALYFYCHGGNTTYNQWLVLQDDDSLLTIHLDDEIRQAWHASDQDGTIAPLVVLNGCHTGKYDPATLLSFVHQFARLGAAGIVGTEIPIHEQLGTAFGEFWVERFLSGEPLGQIIYDFRQHLLHKRNVLGLVYVPYSYADLRLETDRP